MLFDLIGMYTMIDTLDLLPTTPERRVPVHLNFKSNAPRVAQNWNSLSALGTGRQLLIYSGGPQQSPGNPRHCHGWPASAVCLEAASSLRMDNVVQENVY